MVRVVGAEEPIVGENQWRGLLATVWIGAVNGLLTWLLTYFLSHYVINNIACRLGTSFVACSATDVVSAGIALVIATVVTLVFLVRQRVYRPLLVALAAAVALWGVGGSWLVGASWWTVIFTVLISALVYAAVAWLARIRSFAIALVVVVIAVVVFRLAVIS